jgi:hypothetical protein
MPIYYMHTVWTYVSAFLGKSDNNINNLDIYSPCKESAKENTKVGTRRSSDPTRKII